jgi:hypothetical protein
MLKYFKAISDIIKNYQFYSFQVLLNETIFITLYNKKYNKFEYLNSDFLSDSIPCPYLFLKKINNFIKKKNIDQICDLGSGFGKILYFFGKIKKINIDGVELEKKIYDLSLNLQCDKIKIYNQDILTFDLNTKKYELFIFNDPLKNSSDLLKLILRIKKNYKSVYLIFINLDFNKQKLIKKNLIINDQFVASSNKNIFFCSMK